MLRTHSIKVHGGHSQMSASVSPGAAPAGAGACCRPLAAALAAAPEASAKAAVAAARTLMIGGECEWSQSLQVLRS